MKQDILMEALTGIGDDLLQLAQTKRFPNPWRQWGKVAACMALVLCLSVLALPYLPIGCGASQAPADAPAATAPEAMEPGEAPMEFPADRPTADEAPAEKPMEEPAEESSAEAVTDEESPAPEERVSILFEGQWYELQSPVSELPKDLGEELGMVEASDGRDLNGCLIYAVVDSEDLFVRLPEGYARAIPKS